MNDNENKTNAPIKLPVRYDPLSSDYRRLHELLLAGHIVACLIDYDFMDGNPPLRDICKGQLNEHDGFRFGCRGIQYANSWPHKDLSFEKFEELCNAHHIEFFDNEADALRAEVEGLTEALNWAWKSFTLLEETLPRRKGGSIAHAAIKDIRKALEKAPSDAAIKPNAAAGEEGTK